jgi:hypothetical protein
MYLMDFNEILMGDPNYMLLGKFNLQLWQINMKCVFL